MKNQLGIEYNIFEFNGQGKKKILEFRAAPGNITVGMKVMREKLGITDDVDALKAHVKQHTKNIIEGKSVKQKF